MNTELINSQMLATIGGLAGAVNLAKGTHQRKVGGWSS